MYEAIEAAFDVDRNELGAATRGRGVVALARQTGMYLARVAFGMKLTDAGHLFGRDRTTASHACRLVEDRRDDPGFDALLSAIEAFALRTDVPEGRRWR
ncbi:MAG: helix-turn-helix domain-containing protein [Pseudorhodoplanes sp.]|uniref:helix-turn-helix domain-containing protein n=1 Tax=Pseudorhodoplanes sp. TaxID=1934341 RepID=UPI003D10F1BB